MNTESANLKGVRIGITGGTGVLGNKLVDLLLREGADIFCFIRKTSDTEYLENKVTLCRGSLTDINSLKEFVSQIDICIHLAAQVSPTTKENYYLHNVIGTDNICKAIIEQNSDCRLINCSSIAAYRISGVCKMQFTDYAKSKLAADKLVDYYIKNAKLKATTIIPGMIYGPGKNVFIPTIIENLRNNKLFLVEGGEQYVPLSYIDDLCNLFIMATKDKKAIGQKYFGINYTEKGMHDFIRMIAVKTRCAVPDKIYSKKMLMFKAIIMKQLYSLFKPTKHPNLSIRMVDVLSINYKLNKEQRNNNLGWVPSVDMETGINMVLDQYKLNLKPVSDNLVTM